MIHHERTSSLRAGPAEVWRHATSPDGINHELAPWLRMTVPPEVHAMTIADALERLGEPLIVSRMLLLGVLPVERTRITIVELEPDSSSSRPCYRFRSWRHERIVEPAGSGCVLTDKLAFEPAIRLVEPAMRGLVRALSAHRHRKLVARFG